MEDGSDLLPFIRFYQSEHKIQLMPHAKSEEGFYSVTLQALEVSSGNNELQIQNSFEIEVTENIYTAFKTTPGPVEVQIGSKYEFALPAIKNEAKLDFSLTMEDGPKWAKFSKNSRIFTFEPSYKDFEAGSLKLGRFEALMNWNAEG